MPLFSVNMAIPLKEHREYSESQMFFLSSSENVPPEDRGKKYLITKALQLIVCFASLFLFVFGAQFTVSTVQDMIIATSFGALIFYPLLFIFFSIKIEQQSQRLIILNILAVLGLFAIGVVIINSWWEAQAVLDPLEEQRPEDYVSMQRYATIKLISSFFSIINGVLYMAESLIMYLELKGFI